MKRIMSYPTLFEINVVILQWTNKLNSVAVANFKYICGYWSS